MSEDDKNGRAPDSDVGTHMAAKLIEQLVLLNHNMEQNRVLFTDIFDKLDDLTGYHETLGRAFELVLEKSEEGKSKWSLKDFAEAMVDAADEIMPAEDEPGEEDPRVEVER